MAKYEARVETKFGEVVVNFDSVEELKKSIESLDVKNLSAILSEKFEPITRKEPRQAKTGLEGVYRFTPEGKVELLKTPPSAPMTIGLLLYAYDPEPVSSEEMLSRGIKAGDYVSQTGYKKYFDRTPDNRLVLTHPGRLWIETEVIGKLASRTAPDKKANQPSK
jgi:hypothetical protein